MDDFLVTFSSDFILTVFACLHILCWIFSDRMIELVLVRHGETEANKTHTIQVLVIFRIFLLLIH